MKMARRLRLRLCGSAALAAAFTASIPSLVAAQSPRAEPGPSTSVAELVVTAEKRTERLQDVPVSVTALGGSSLEAMRAERIEDWAGFVPGVNFADNGAPGETTLALDGIAPIGAASELGIYVDETPVGSSSSFEGANGFSLDLMPYDLTRVEVVRGPQGTLYGASTMGGLIKYVLAAPDSTHLSARIGGDVFGIANAGAPGGGVRGEVNAPLVSDRLALRLSAYDEYTPGYIDDATTGARGDNRLQQAGGRLALRWQASADLSVQLEALQQYTHANNRDFVALNPAGQPLGGSLSNINTLPEPYTQELQLYSATVGWDLHWAKLTSVSSYQAFRNDTVQDLTRYIGVYLGLFGAPGPGQADFHENYRLKKFTQEIRLASPEGSRLEWLLGGFYTHETGVNYEVFNAYDGAGAPLANFNPLEFVRLPSTYEEYAAFGDATFHFNRWFDLGAGIRFAHNDQRFTEVQGGVLVGSNPPSAPALTVPGASSENVTTFAVTPRVHLGADTMAYARIASGYQPGGPNVVLPGVTGLPATFASSRLTDYQVGLKSTFLEGRATADLSAFYIDWSKIQVGVLIGNESAVENAGAARSEGVDFAGTLSPAPGLTLGATIAYDDAILTTAVPSIGTVAGARLPYTPMWSGSLSVEYTRPVNDRWRGFVGGGWRYTGSRYSAPQGSTANGEAQGLEASAYGALDAHLGVRSKTVEVSLFVKNLTDRRAYLAPVTFFYDALQTQIDVQAPVLQPRTVGLSLDAAF